MADLQSRAPLGKMSKAVDREKQERELFAKYLSTATALVADPIRSSRVRLGSILAELGAKQNGILFAGNYEEAMAAIKERKPKIILCEFTLGAHSGLDLLQEQRKQDPQSRDTVFALITGNTSQSAAAAAAEEDVDTFILKPYKGQVEQLKEAMETASKEYKKGLSFNKIHYKCLIGLYELMMTKKEHQEAYSVVKKLAQYFPANPKRLAQVLRLAIMTASYEDIESYYRIFTLIETRNDELVRYVCSALIVTGKYYFLNNYNSRAFELLEEAAVSCAGKTSYLKYIIEVLAEFDRFEEARGVLKRFPASAQREPDYLSMDLLIAQKSLAPGELIQKGRDLIKAGIETPIVYEVLIDASQKARLYDSASELLLKANRNWPDQSKRFEKFDLSVSTSESATARIGSAKGNA